MQTDRIQLQQCALITEYAGASIVINNSEGEKQMLTLDLTTGSILQMFGFFCPLEGSKYLVVFNILRVESSEA